MNETRFCPLCDWQLPASYSTDSLRSHLASHSVLDLVDAAPGGLGAVKSILADHREIERAVIVQAVKPGDVVFIEAQRELRGEEMERIKELVSLAALGVRVVVLPPELKVAPAPRNPP
jgi:hypothetical protein